MIENIQVLTGPPYFHVIVTIKGTGTGGKHMTKKNGMVIRKAGARRFIGQNDKVKQAEARMHAKLKKLFKEAGISPAESNAQVACEFYFATTDPRRVGVLKGTKPDTLNMAAMVHDALEGAAYDDDAQVVLSSEAKFWAQSDVDYMKIIVRVLEP